MDVSAVAPVDSYLICGTPRTGSTLLCGLLRSTGVAGVPESYFRFPDEQSWVQRWQLARDPGGAFDYGDYVRAAVDAGSTDNGVFDARVMWGTMDEVVAKLGAIDPALARADLELLTSAFGSTRFVHLCRRDTVAQAVSWVRAEQTLSFLGHEVHADRPIARRHQRQSDGINHDWIARYYVGGRPD
jgi:LPS sulfotransferase NodH